MANMEDLPVIGNITVPLKLMGYDEKGNDKKYFQSFFAHWKLQDSMCDVGEEDNKVGHIGGTFGGHTDCTRYYPNDKDTKKRIHVIVDVRDMWDAIEKLVDSQEAEVFFEGLEEVYAKYKAKDEKLKEIKQMQRDAEKEEKRKKFDAAQKKMNDLKIEEARLAQLEKQKKDRAEAEKQMEETKKYPNSYQLKDYLVLNDGGWDLEENLSGSDYNFRDVRVHRGHELEHPQPEKNRDENGKIPVNIGCGVLLEDKRGKRLYTNNTNDSYGEGTVTLELSSWIGISPEAMHTYATLKFSTPSVHPEGKPNTSTSCFLNLFGQGKIEVTRILEQWELDKYHHTYDNWYAGDEIRGFYTSKEAIEAGKKAFEEFFGKGWTLKIEDNS